jgi:hypothetical protein
MFKRTLQFLVIAVALFVFTPTSKAQSTSELIYNCVEDSIANGLPSSLAETGCYFEVYMGEGLDASSALFGDILDGFFDGAGSFESGTDMEYDPYDEYVHGYLCANCSTDVSQ